MSSLVGEAAGLSTYYGLVASRVSYGIIFWGRCSETERIFKIQKSCLRSIYNIQQRGSCRNIFKEKGILTVTAIYIRKCCCFVRKNYDVLFAAFEPKHSHHTRQIKMHCLEFPKEITDLSNYHFRQRLTEFLAVSLPTTSANTIRLRI